MGADRFRASSDAFVGLDAMSSNVPTRRIDDVEVPTAGIWPAAGVSSVVRPAGRRGLRTFPVLAGWFEIGEDPAAISVRIDLDDCTLVGSTSWVFAADNGRTEWLLEGFAQRDEWRDPLQLNMSYRGVFHRGTDVWAWMSGTGTIRTTTERRGVRRWKTGSEVLVAELLFMPPDPGRVPPIAPRDRTISRERVMQIPSVGSLPVGSTLR